MASSLVLLSVFQIIFTFSCVCSNSDNYVNNTTVYTPQLFQSFIPYGKRDFDPRNSSNIPAGQNGTKQIRNEGRKAFFCICTSAKELNATVVLPLSITAATNGDEKINNVLPQFGTFAHFKILQCPKKNIVCRKWKPHQNLSNYICHNEENKEVQANNVKEVHTNSCIVIVNGKESGHSETVNKRSWTGKSDHLIPMIKNNRSKIAIVLDQNSTMALSYIRKTFKLDTTATISPTNRQRITLRNISSSTLRQRRSSTINLRSMIFPNLNRNLVERKRNNSKNNDTEIKMAEMEGNATNHENKNASLHDGISIPEIHREHRQKREMHVLMAKYRKKEIKKIPKRSRNKRPKTTPRPNYFDDKDDCNDKGGSVSSTPYTFLNVSFTGYWEHEERTTVKPRIKQPLKMSKKDLEFVYGNSGGYEKQRDKGKNKGKSGGWSSKLTMSIKS